MIHRVARVFFAVIPLLLLAACSTNPAAPKANGTSQTTLPRPPMPQASAPLIFPEDAQEPVHRSSELFPRPSEIEPQVRFWKKVYATWNRGQAAIHDKRHMNVVYEVVQIPGEAATASPPARRNSSRLVSMTGGAASAIWKASWRRGRP